MLFQVSDDEVISGIVQVIYEDKFDYLVEVILDKYDMDNIAEHIDLRNLADYISMTDLGEEIDVNEIEIDYDDLAGKVWDRFADEFGPSMKCVREELAIINEVLNDLRRPFWKRWLNIGKEAAVETAETAV